MNDPTNAPNKPGGAGERIPPPGTMAYAQWKRRQELLGQKPETQQTGQPASQPASQEATQAALQPTRQATRQPTPQPARRPTRSQPGGVDPILAKRLKPLDDEEPTHKVTFLVTPDEAELLEELKLQLRRRYRLKTTKNDILRAAIRLVAQDFAKNQPASFLVRKLGGK